MTIIGVVGKPRTGKTLYMVLRAYINYQKGYKIFSNFKCSFATRLEMNEMLQIAYTEMERNPKMLMIQEIDKIFNSKRATSNENTLLGGLTGQSGKRNMDIIWDTQFPHLVDTQVRNITEECITCSALEMDNKPIAFTYRHYDIYEQSTNPNYMPKEYTIPAYILEPLYKMYDSYEPTKSKVKNQKMYEILGIQEDALTNA